MKTKLPKGVSSYRDRHGRRRWRFRSKHGKTFQLGTEFGTEEFWARLSAAEQGEVKKGTQRNVRGDSVEAVFRNFLKSPTAKGWAPNTYKTYVGPIEEIMREFGHLSMATMETRHVEAIMAKKADTPTAANRRRKVLGYGCKHAMKMGIVQRNVAIEAATYKVSGDGYHTWTEGEVTRYLDVHRDGTIAHTAFMLMLCTGAARGDVVTFGWRNIVGDRLVYRREKTKNSGGVEISIPISTFPELKRLLDSLPRDSFTFLETKYGKARSANGLGNLMRAACDKAGLPECSAHGLRKRCATRLANAGCTPHQVAAITGHKSLAMVQRYTRDAERAGLADAAVVKLHKKKTGTKLG